jgi:hypothetical protein
MIDLVERVVANADDVPRAAGELVAVAACSLLLAALNVPLSIRSAQWADCSDCFEAHRPARQSTRW